MGAWGLRALDNDDACDWADGLDDATDLSPAETALGALEAVGDEYLDSVVASTALAACDVLARCLGKPGYQSANTRNADAWVAKHKLKPPPALLKRAENAIDRILGDDSELRQLVEESQHGVEWRALVEDLRQRLRASPQS